MPYQTGAQSHEQVDVMCTPGSENMSLWGIHFVG